MNYLKEFENNLAYHFSEVLEYPLAKPHWIYISLSHKCTYSCKMCGVSKILRGQELPLATVKNTLDEISRWGSDCVVVFTGGETFLRKDIFEIIAYAAQKGIKAEAVSNGYLINEKLAARIVSSGLQNIAISLDGATEGTHDFIREKGSFKKATDAMRFLAEAKKMAGGGPQISVWTTIMKENVRELCDIIPLVKGLGVECLVYHPVIVAQDDMQNTSSGAPFWIRGEELDVLREQIGRIMEFQKDNTLVGFLHDPYLWIKYFQGTLKKTDWKCNPFVFINIGPDANVRSCGSAFGNIKEMSLAEALQTDDSWQARKGMKLCEKPCLQTCWAHPGSDSLERVIQDFISKIRNDKNRRQLLKDALKTLDGYQAKLTESLLPPQQAAGLPGLREVIISITGRCNAHCRMCDIPAQKQEELPTRIWENVIKDAASLGAKTIVFSGGEPLLRPDIFELIASAKNNHLQACITSNGYLIDDETAKKLFEAGVDVVNISLEGPQEIHDYLRGAGYFARAEAALENLKKYGIESTIATVVSRHNYKYLETVVEQAKKLGATTIKFQPFSSMFLERGRDTQEFIIPAGEQEELKRAINKAAQLCVEYGIATNPAGYLAQIPSYATRKQEVKPASACQSILRSCPIDSAGTIFPCWVINQTDAQIGNIKDRRLLSLWNSHKRSSIIEKIKKNGCPGCMMACYDDSFGADSVKLRAASNVKRLKILGAGEYAKRLLRKWKKRISFYRGYRGSAKVLAARFRKLLINKDLGGGAGSTQEIKLALKEIEGAKRALAQELDGL